LPLNAGYLNICFDFLNFCSEKTNTKVYLTRYFPGPPRIS